MNDVLKCGKKAFTWSVVVLTILWSVGISTLAPMVVHAESECPALEAGDLFKVPGVSSVYMLDSDMKAVYFPTNHAYYTWFADYSNIVEIPVSCNTYALASHGLNNRPGSYLVKRPSNNDVFAILPNNTKAKLGSEEVAAALYGANWYGKVRDIADIFMTNLVNTAAEITTAIPHDGMLIKTESSSMVYYVSGGQLHQVEGTLLRAGEVNTVSDTVFNSLEVATGSVTAASILVNPPQTVAGATPETPVVPSGNLTVSLSANTPAASNVVINTDNVLFGKFMFTAAGGDVNVASVKIGRKGLGSKDDFVSVTLYDGNTKLGTSKTSWDSNTQTMTYNIASGWAIPSGSTKELTVVAKLDTAGTYNALGILGVNGVDITAVYGNEMSGVDVTVGALTISNMGTAATKKIGLTGVTMAEFKLTVSSTEDVELQKVTLKNKGTAADSNVANFYLYQGATKLAGPVSMVSDKIAFVLDTPVTIAKSQNETFKVVGDIIGGDGNTVEFVLENTTDLTAIGKSYGTNVTVNSGDYNEASDFNCLITIDGAELNVAYTGSNVDTMDNVSDVVFGTLTLGAGATDIKVTSLVLTIDETDGNSSVVDNWDIDNFEMVETNGGSYSADMTNGDLPDAASADADSETWTFSDEIYLTANQTRTFTLRGDVPDGVGNGDSYKVRLLDTSTDVVAETSPDGDIVDNFSIGSFTGMLVTVKSPVLKVAGVSQNSGTAVVNDANVILYKGTLEAQASNIRVTYANFDANTTFSTANWTDVGFYTVDSAGLYQLKQRLTNSQMTSGTLTFDSMDFTVTNGASNKVTFVVMGTVASTLNTNNVAVLKLDYLTAKASDNSSPTITSGSDDLSTADGEFLTAGGRSVTLYDKGKLYIQMRSSDTGYNKDRIMLAGSSAWVGKLKLKADDESIKIKDLKLTNAVTTANDDATSVCLYRAETVSAENLISCQTIAGDGTVFYDDIDEVVDQGTEYWYIYVNSASMTNGAAGTADTHDYFSFNIVSTTGHVVAEGVRSGYNYTFSGVGVTEGEYAFDYDMNDTYGEAVDGLTASTRAFIIAGTKISGVSMVSSYGGETVDTAISGTGEYTVAILAVTTDATGNTDNSGNVLKTQLKGLSLDVAKYTSTTIDTATIKRIGGLDAAGSLTVTTLGDGNVAGSVGTSSLSALLTNDYKIESGTTAYFVVKVNVSALSTADNVTDWFRFYLNDLKGTYNTDANNNIDWNDGYPSTGDFNALLLDTESDAGVRVSE